MEASARRGRQLPPTHFRLNPKLANTAGGRPVTLQLPRPPDGFTATFASFSDGHPAFQLHRENVRESDALRFNHQLHMNGPGIPPTEAGTKLDCNYCHKPEPNGRYMQRVSFAANCQSCHSLQFDVKNPDFQLPHGDAQLVRTFLRTLPAQYAEFARRRRGMTNENRIGEFTAQQLRDLLTQFRSGEELERTVFFTKDPYATSQQSPPATRAKYHPAVPPVLGADDQNAICLAYPTARVVGACDFEPERGYSPVCGGDIEASCAIQRRVPAKPFAPHALLFFAAFVLLCCRHGRRVRYPESE